MKSELLKTLDAIKGNGVFFTSHAVGFVLPGLVIDGVGEMYFPVNQEQLQTIIAAADQAPYGKGDQTLVDKEVRNVWEIDASKLTFKNPQWASQANKIVKQVKADFGLKSASIEARLYKLLIYEEGSFFLPHKDSEKEKGMFGTLIVNLPSAHTGGELNIRFDGKEHKVDFSSLSEDYTMGYAAFFSDCEHEVLPVRSGYRVSLVYNLIQTGASRLELAHSYAKQTRELTQLLIEAKPSFSTQPKAIILGHEYTPANFALDSLKHHDKPRAMVLMEAAKAAGYCARLALVTKYEEGDADFDGYEYDYYHGGADSEPSEMGEVYEESLYIEHWAQDRLPNLGQVHLSDSDVFSGNTLNEGEPTERSESEYTGNAGMTIEYWYHHGAVVLWPEQYHLDIVNDLNIAVKLNWLSYYGEHLQEYRSEVISIIKHLGEDDYSEGYYSGSDRTNFSIVARVLTDLGDPKLFRNQFSLFEKIFDRIAVSQWVGLLRHYDLTVFGGLFSVILRQSKISYMRHYLDVMSDIVKSDDEKYHLWAKSEFSDLPKVLQLISMEDKAEKQNVFLIVASLLQLREFYDEETTRQVGKYLISFTSRSYVNNALVINLLEVHRDGYKHDLIKAVSNYCLEDLQHRTAERPMPPGDFSRKVPKSRDHKAVWDLLSNFLTSPTDEIFDYRARKDMRQRVEAVVRKANVDLQLQTIAKGSPHILRLTKTQAAYERQLKKWKQDSSLLNSLRKIIE